MGDSFMIMVVLAVMASPFLPLMLKSKCPVCTKRKLEHLETVNTEAGSGKTFITYYRCHNCNSRFQRDKSGPLQAMENEETAQAEAISA